MPKPLLLNRKSGLYVRFFVPSDLQARVGSKYLVRSLQCVRADAARLMAAALGYALSKAFERLRMDAMTEPKGLLDLALAGVKTGEVYDIELPKQGVFTLLAKGERHHDFDIRQPFLTELSRLSLKTREMYGRHQ